MQELEQRIIEIRDEINSIESKMNSTYSKYESIKDEREDAEINLENLNTKKKEVVSKIFSFKLFKLCKVLLPINLFIFGIFSLRGILFTPAVIRNDILIIISSLVASFGCTYFESFLLSHLTNHFGGLEDILIGNDNEFLYLKSEDRKISKKISHYSCSLRELRIKEKAYADDYSSLSSKLNRCKDLLDEVESKYFEKTKTIISELKTYNLYTLLNSLSDEEMETAVNSIEKNLTKTLK